MIDLDEEPTQTDAHFDHVILERLHRRLDVPRSEHAWLSAPDEESRAPAAAVAMEARMGDLEKWVALHHAMRRLSGVEPRGPL